MKASIEWLNEYVDLSGLAPSEIARKLTMAGLEVEELRDRFAFLNQVAAVRLVTAAPLPGSDHLKICQADAGELGAFQVLCGAPNAREGLLAPLALAGAALPGGAIIKVTEMRGCRSEGMLCSEAELGLGPEASGLLELANARPGQTLKELTGREDWTMEIGITPNRSDALSIIGLARDLGAVLNRPLKYPDVRLVETGPAAEGLARIDIEAPDHCLRFASRILQGVKIGPSPQWLADRLAAVGIRAINNVVDVTNYVMMEMGQPLHAYDLDLLVERRIVVKTFKNGQRFTTLDGQDRTLTAAVNLMICDGARPVGLAGIMGGLNTEITDGATNILLEGAAFNATTIRRTSRTLGLSTEASYRYERGCDPEICGLAVDRAIALMAELGGGQVARGRLDNYPRPHKVITVPFSPARCNAFLGASHQPEDMVRALTAIGLTLTGRGDGRLEAALPSWRPDLHREVDVWEEVARLLDFDGLPATLPAPPQICRRPPAAWRLREQVRDFMVSRGLCESISYSFINPKLLDKLGFTPKDAARARLLPLINPLTEDHGALRTTLAPSLLAALRQNQYHGAWSVALFEVGGIFLANGPGQQPDEPQTIGGLMSGPVGEGRWCDPARPTDFWDAKGLLEGLADSLGRCFTFAREEELLPPYYNPAEAAVVRLNGQFLGHLGRLADQPFKAFGLREAGGPVYLFELNAEVLLAHDLPAARFQAWARYPSLERDLALVLDKETPAARVLEAVTENAAWPLRNLTIFDLYQGSQLPPDKKGLALRLSFQDQEKTLTEEAVAVFCAEITQRLAERFGAVLRT